MADFKAKRRNEAEIRKAWESDAPIKSAELAIIMAVPRCTVSEWSRKGMPRVGWLIRKSSFDAWWNRYARKTARKEMKPKPTKEAIPEKVESVQLPAILREPPSYNLPPRAAKLFAMAEAPSVSGKAGHLLTRANR